MAGLNSAASTARPQQRGLNSAALPWLKRAGPPLPHCPASTDRLPAGGRALTGNDVGSPRQPGAVPRPAAPVCQCRLCQRLQLLLVPRLLVLLLRLRLRSQAVFVCCFWCCCWAAPRAAPHCRDSHTKGLQPAAGRKQQQAAPQAAIRISRGGDSKQASRGSAAVARNVSRRQAWRSRT
jgi:hypothetical protein